MVTTVCMNPSLDKTATVRRVALGEVNRLTNIRYDVGGKGLNVALVLQRLGIEVSCVGCLGSADEAAFLELLKRESLSFHYLSLQGKIRVNFKLLDAEAHSVTEFNEPGLPMNMKQLEQFVTLLQMKAESSNYVVLCGSIPAGCENDTYQRCMRALPNHRCVLDAEGASLLPAIREKPFLIKPNLPELGALMGRELHSLNAIRDAALTLINHGAQNVIVSMGKRGALLTDGKRTLYSPALQVEANSTVGAGDAMLGGVLMGLDKGTSLWEAFRYGVAAGAASVMMEGTQPLRRSDFESLLPRVTQQEV